MQVSSLVVVVGGRSPPPWNAFSLCYSSLARAPARGMPLPYDGVLGRGFVYGRGVPLAGALVSPIRHVLQFS